MVETLGLPVKSVAWMRLDPSGIVVKVYRTNEKGQKYLDPEHPDEIAADYHTFAYDTVSVLREDLQRDEEASA